VGNKLGNIRELKILEKISSLLQLDFHDSEFGSNPFCKNLNTYYSEILMMNNCERIKVDGRKFSEIVYFLEKGKFQDLK